MHGPYKAVLVQNTLPNSGVGLIHGFGSLVVVFGSPTNKIHV